MRLSQHSPNRQLRLRFSEDFPFPLCVNVSETPVLLAVKVLPNQRCHGPPFQHLVDTCMAAQELLLHFQ